MDMKDAKGLKGLKSINAKALRGVLDSTREKIEGTMGLALAKSFGLQILVGGFSILLSRVAFTDGVYPFGLALVIGVPDRFALASLIGFVINNWIGDTIVGANSAYIGAVGVVVALRWILAGMRRGRYRKDNYLPCLTAGLLSVIITEVIILALTGTFSWATVGRLAGGVALTGGFSYFYHNSFDALSRRRSLYELTSIQKACLALSLCTVLMALYPLTIGPFSVGRMVGALAVIFACFLLSAPLDSVVFAAVAASIALCEPEFLFAGVGICVGGILCGLFKKRGKAVMCLIFIVISALFAVSAPNYIYAMTYLSELLFGSLIFLLVPIKTASNVRFEHLSETMSSATSAISVKLNSISAAMRDITALLDKTVSVKDARRNMDELYSQSVEKVCRNCGRVSFCWVKCYNDTADALNRLSPILAKDGQVTADHFSAPFNARCINMPGLAKEITARYASRVETMQRVRNTQLYKDMLKKQFEAVSDMLDNARNELCTLKEWDENKSKRIFDCAVRLQLPVETAGCVYDGDHRPIVTVTLRSLPTETLIKRLTAGIALIVGVTLGKPTIEDDNGYTVLCFNEQPLYNIKTATSQICADGKVCGDVYSIFTDLKGNVHLLLSDGMGTGAAAARDGAVCCAFLKRLLESGFSIKRAAELANSALSMREETEAASTMDALSFNVFEGGARLFKAGAAPTCFLHGTNVAKIDGRSLPVGILDKVVSKEFELPITDGDVVVMTSDGIPSSSYRIIEETLKTSFGATAEEICREIMYRAQNVEDLRDDVTVIVAKISLHKNTEAKV